MSGRLAFAVSAAAMLSATIVVSACSEMLGVTEQGVASHRAQWEAAGLSAYRYEYSKQCECLPETLRPVLVEVQGGSVERVTFVDDGQVPETLHAGSFPTIDDLFDLIDEAAGMSAASLVVTYDRALGYPTLISVDYRRDIADDEISIRASNLEAA